jgi:RNA polymerase sigma-70 factor (ECF subfamily)
VRHNLDRSETTDDLPPAVSQVVEFYDRLIELNDSPVAALNRAVALAEVQGPQAGIEAVQEIQNLHSLESYHLFYAVLGEFELRLNHSQAAATNFQKSLQLAEIESERVFLSKQLQNCQDVNLALLVAHAPATLRN